MILMFSLLLAFFMWSMHRMTRKYSAVLDYKVELSSNIEGRAQSAVSRNSLVLRGKSSGFFIFQQRYLKQQLPLFVDARQLKMLPNSNDIFYVKSSDIQNKVQEALGNDFQLENVTSDTLYFRFPRQANKKVPIAATESISFDAQYMNFGSLSLRPDSVVIYGNADVIGAIDSVYTKEIKKSGASESVQGIIALKPLNGVRFSDENVYYNLDVVRYFESSVVVKPIVSNVLPGSKAILVPQEITLYYRMRFENKRSIEARDFTLAVDCSELENSNMVMPKIVRQPDDVFYVRFEPKFVECIIN